MVSFRIFRQLVIKEVKVISRRFTSATHKKNCTIESTSNLKNYKHKYNSTRQKSILNIFFFLNPNVTQSDCNFMLKKKSIFKIK